MAIEYPGRKPKKFDIQDPNNIPEYEVSDNVKVLKVEDSFERIRNTGEPNAVRNGKNVFPKDRYTKKNRGGNNRTVIHFQGIQRVPDSKHLIISGGDNKQPMSQLFVLELNSKNTTKAIGSNIKNSKDNKPPSDDKLSDLIALDRDLWHPGGLSLYGNILAVPLENGKKEKSEVIFLDIKKLSEPVRLPVSIPRAAKGGAVAFTRLPQNDHFVAVVWSDSDDDLKPRFDFYFSNSTKLLGGFSKSAKTVTHDEIIYEGQERPKKDGVRKYQNINFITQTDDQIFMIGSFNTSSLAPVRGDDYLELLKIEFEKDTLKKQNRTLKPPKVKWITEKKLKGKDEYFSNAAAGGVYISPEGRLLFYSGYHWRRKNQIRFSEFRTVNQEIVV